jgi:hypothetical protein
MKVFMGPEGTTAWSELVNVITYRTGLQARRATISRALHHIDVRLGKSRPADFDQDRLP